MEGTNENWQTNSSLDECVRKMFENHLDNGDVTFKVGSEGAEVKAHKFILMCRSKVLSSMLDTQTKTSEKDVWTVNDIRKETFIQFLEFLYTDKTAVTVDNIEELLLCAHRYETKLLARLCTTSVGNIITVGTICELIRIAERFKESEMINICLERFGKLRQEYSPMLLFTKAFLQMCPSCIYRILEDDKIFASEEIIFNQVVLWSKKECKRQSLTITAQNQRKILSHVLKEVRFPIMEHQYLNDVVCPSEILTVKRKLIYFDNS